jgi:nickel-dependent lactate racemase
MLVKVPYGKSEVEFQIDETRLMGIISPSEVAPSANPDLEVERALKTPIDGPTIGELSRGGKTVAIAVDDVTRVTPTYALLKPMLRLLKDAGVRRQDIKIIVALGSHRAMTVQEKKEKYGADVVEEYGVIDHAFDDESELRYLGEVAGDLPVWINKEYLKADVRIATGSILPHQNAGWGAGAKILLPGLAGEETIGRMHVHSATTKPNALGMDENPTRQLIDTLAAKVGIQLVVNTVVTRRREIAKVLAGHFVKAHRRGIDFAKSIYSVKTSGLADITISSSHPADIFDYWQALKGLFSADLATKPAGGIIELAPCPEGISATHPRWIQYLQHTTKELREMYKAGEVEDLVALGLALNVVYVREKHPVCLVSDGVSDRDAAKMRFTKFDSVKEALQFLSSRYGSDSSINVLTHGGETYPILK